MLISEFARKTGLTTDTVRFYVRRGLLTPETNGKGGRNPYRLHRREHVRLGASNELVIAVASDLPPILMPRERTRKRRPEPRHQCAGCDANGGTGDNRSNSRREVERRRRSDSPHSRHGLGNGSRRSGESLRTLFYH
jgi:hypothetical protein